MNAGGLFQGHTQQRLLPKRPQSRGCGVIMADCPKQVSLIYPGLLRGCVGVKRPGDPMGVGKVSEVQPGQSRWVRHCLPSSDREREVKRRKDSLGTILGCSRTGGEFSKSGGRGSGRRELFAWGHSEAAPRLLGDAPARATPRGGARRGRAAGRGAARLLWAPGRMAQVRARVGGRGPLPHELGARWGFSPPPAAMVTSLPSSGSASSSRSRGHPAPV